MKKTFLTMYLLAMLCAQTFAQSESEKVKLDKIKNLNIGDKVPDISFNLINNSKASIQLSELKGKLVILDFYGLYCSVCLEAMPKNDALQRAFENEVQFITVNHEDTPEKIAISFNKLTNNPDSWWGMKKFNWNKSNILFAVNDKNANTLFPHLTVPHYVWIGQDGIVKAITSSKDITSENIAHLLKTGSFEFRKKMDIHNNLSLITGNPSLSEVSAIVFFKRGEMPNVGYGMSYHEENGIKRGVGIRNKPLLTIYQYILGSMYPNLFFNEKWMKFEVKDISQIFYLDKSIPKKTWEKANWYTYDLIVPTEETDSIYKYAFRDINKYSGFNGEFGKRNIKCYVLQTIKGKENFKSGDRRFLNVTNDAWYVKNQPLSYLTNNFNGSGSGIIKYPVIDETGYKGNVDLELPADYSDFIALNNALKKSGLELIEAEREIEMFVISDKK